MAKYFLYARKSTDEEDKQIMSIESQINELREFAKKENLEIAEEFTEAKTAKEPGRGRPIFSYVLKRLGELNRQDEQEASSRLAQSQAKLKEFDSQIERLIDLYVAKELTQEEYQRKKAKLLNEKKVLEGQVDNVRTKGGGWLEPAKEFVSTCNAAGSIAWQGNPSAKRAFLKNLGSNFVLKDRNLIMKRAYLYDLVAKISPSGNWLPL